MFARFYTLRYICVIAVVALFAGSVLMFLSGALHTIEAYQIFFFGHSVVTLPGHLSENTIASVVLIQAVDAFLFALVLLIFSYGVYTLFVHREEEMQMKLPRWLRIETISQLKTTLVQVIIVILAVNLLEYVVVAGSESLRWEALIIPASMVGLALALKLMHTGQEV
ncbi:YqhA family protein [Methanoregula sp.]|uniref:YqhA family protein n=1 Tax=Methanoregula sp. TaxID=2052170 RepID=UPI002611A7B0|nr:YqhA family protein [Methanoregula sp.]MDD5141828.1 YqhA family protein [Methanoregula sp.]